MTTRRTWRGTLLAIVLWTGGALVAVVAAAAAWDVVTYDAKARRRDFDHLKHELAQRYANLDWIAFHRGLDLAKLDAQTSNAIENAHSRVVAYFALKDFISAFHDPHLKLVWGDRSAQTREPEPAAPSGVTAEPSAGASCEEEGYETADYAFRFPFDRLASWTRVSDSHFPAGLSGDLGVLRIASFGEDQYLAACKLAFRSGLTARDLKLATRALLQQELIATLGKLRSQGARRLLVDVSGNGGGAEWVSEVVALMTDRELVRRPSQLVDPQCDRSAVWRGETACPVLAPSDDATQTTGTGQWTGPLYLLADHRTGSASEDFLAWLQQNDVATVLGERTAGEGCGYVNGGGRIRLDAIPFDVMASNCTRFLNDGTNEIEGITPDTVIAMEKADPARQIEALVAALGETI